MRDENRLELGISIGKFQGPQIFPLLLMMARSCNSGNGRVVFPQAQARVWALRILKGVIRNEDITSSCCYAASPMKPANKIGFAAGRSTLRCVGVEWLWLERKTRGHRMLWVQRFEGRAETVPVLGDVAKIIGGIGRDHFASAALDVLSEAIGIDHMSMFRFATNGAIDYHEATTAGGSYKDENAANQYFRRFNRLDPVRTLSRGGLPRGTVLVVRNRAEDIVDPLYRHECYVAPEIGERLALYGRVGRRNLQVNVYRRASRECFDARAADTFARIATILLPSAARHAEFATGGDDQNGLRLSLVALKHRIERLQCGLSERELEVCARALYGQSIDGTGLELNIARTSVVTYRRRAYAKLRISGYNELVALAFRAE